ncbi:hypothetical protein GGTG_11014 [Gaeumannomyces tritici R3-111a-1]|uniref:Uncharacterized protein n=1 Tax=Gaeumannomyces tritici (strain R3-111a-1) TaxID=644352 RepID=J3PBZ0_GAET3|nr:hypothetical protein GGTG_11014 [Gaeumannomyces tritici R3-111a-1]EJT71760.1 hypothetical protein GGTG_11014 [Gaeumannomyces tritici R3-111a-1]
MRSHWGVGSVSVAMWACVRDRGSEVFWGVFWGSGKSALDKLPVLSNESQPQSPAVSSPASPEIRERMFCNLNQAVLSGSSGEPVAWIDVH